MGIIISILYCSIFLAVGYGVSRLFFPGERPLIRAWLGGVCGLALLLWLPALLAFPLGFTPLAQYAALGLCVVLGAFCLLKLKKSDPSFHSPWRGEWPVLVLLPLFLLGGYLFFTHYIPAHNGALYAGQSTFGDLPLHLGIVTSVSAQGTFPPMYSILPGTAVGYPFLCDTISATFYVLGAPLRFSMLLPAIIAYGLVLLGVYCFFERWLAKKSTVILAVLLFFVGGGFGFAYFFDGLKANPHTLAGLFSGFYTTPTNYVEKGLIWVNPIADMLIPQRATLFGWALLFPALFFLRRAAFEEDHRFFLPLGVLAGLMPLVHTHSFFALGIVSACYLVRALIRRDTPKGVYVGFLIYGGIAALLAAPQLLLFTFRQTESFLSFHFNWANSTDEFLWFYIKNLGLLFLLLPIAFFRLPKKEKAFYAGALVLWALSEFIQFQPNPYDNNKLLFVWFAYTCGIVAKLLTDVYRALREWKGITAISAMVLVCMFLSGVLTLGRETVSEYRLFSAEEAEAAEFIKANTAPDDLFLTATNHNNLVASLTGRNILCGTGAYLFYHGLNYATREQEIILMYSDPETYFLPLSEQYGIDYILMGDYERYGSAVDEAYFEDQYPIVFDNGAVRIYQVTA